MRLTLSLQVVVLFVREGLQTWSRRKKFLSVLSTGIIATPDNVDLSLPYSREPCNSWIGFLLCLTGRRTPAYLRQSQAVDLCRAGGVN